MQQEGSLGYDPQFKPLGKQQIDDPALLPIQLVDSR
jgi:hypothetical protein